MRPSETAPRRLTWPKLLLVFLGFLTLPEIVTIVVVGAETLDEDMRTLAGQGALLMLAFGKALFVGVVVWRLGWWRLVLSEPLRTRRWVWAVPVILLATSVAAVDWDRLQDARVEQVLLFAMTMLAVGVAEEMLCRGIALQAMRARHREFTAAVLSAALFGLMHLVNLLVLGGGALGEVVVAFFIGFAYYVCRRLSGGLVLPILLHATYDFANFSPAVGTGDPDPLNGARAMMVVLGVLIGLVLLICYRLLDPRPQPHREAAAPDPA